MKKYWLYWAIVVILCFSLTGCSDEKRVSGYTWLGGDDSKLLLEKDGTFIWYQNPENTEDHYYTGTYEVYNGRKAITFLSELPESNLTKEDQEEMIGHLKNHRMKHYFALILYREYHMIDGQNVLTETETKPYYGFLVNEDTYLDLIDMTTQTYQNFTKEVPAEE